MYFDVVTGAPACRQWLIAAKTTGCTGGTERDMSAYVVTHLHLHIHIEFTVNKYQSDNLLVTSVLNTLAKAQSYDHKSTILSNRERGAASGGEGGKGRSRIIQEDLQETITERNYCYFILLR